MIDKEIDHNFLLHNTTLSFFMCVFQPKRHCLLPEEHSLSSRIYWL